VLERKSFQHYNETPFLLASKSLIRNEMQLLTETINEIGSALTQNGSELVGWTRKFAFECMRGVIFYLSSALLVVIAIAGDFPPTPD
jgi:K+-transporting ATPase A subunit